MYLQCIDSFVFETVLLRVHLQFSLLLERGLEMHSWQASNGADDDGASLDMQKPNALNAPTRPVYPLSDRGTSRGHCGWDCLLGLRQLMQDEPPQLCLGVDIPFRNKRRSVDQMAESELWKCPFGCPKVTPSACPACNVIAFVRSIVELQPCPFRRTSETAQVCKCSTHSQLRFLLVQIASSIQI